MDEMLGILGKMDAVVLLIVVISSQILSIKWMQENFKTKFAIPLVLAILAAIVLHFPEGYQVIAKNSIKYAGTSMVVFEFWKNIKRKLGNTVKDKQGDKTNG